MPRMVCRGCLRFLKPKKNGIMLEEGRPLGGGAWGPYKPWMADLWACPGCGAEIVAGFGQGPFAEHYQPTYAEMCEKYPPLFRVDDC